MDTDKITLTPAERMYKAHLRNVANYQRKNPEKIKEKQRRYTQKRREHPQRHQEFLQKRRDYYRSVAVAEKKSKKEENAKNTKNEKNAKNA